MFVGGVSAQIMGGQPVTGSAIQCPRFREEITVRWLHWQGSNGTFVLSTEKSNGHFASSVIYDRYPILGHLGPISNVDVHSWLMLECMMWMCVLFTYQNICIMHKIQLLHLKLDFITTVSPVKGWQLSIFLCLFRMGTVESNVSGYGCYVSPLVYFVDRIQVQNVLSPIENCKSV